MPNKLGPNESIPVDGRITSQNGLYSLVMQGDGNLFLYQFGYVPLWVSHTANHQVSRAMMQNDGNFVIYNSLGNVIWSSQTAGNPGSSLIIQDDGNVVIYDTNHAPIWNTGTWHNNSVLPEVDPPPQEQEVGNSKIMRTDAILYRNGNLTFSVYSKSSHLTEGLRGRVIIQCLDYHDNPIWITEEIQCKTRGSIFDLFTPSAGIDNFSVNLDPLIGTYTGSLRISQGDGTTGVSRAQAIDQIKEYVKVAGEVGSVLAPIIAAL